MVKNKEQELTFLEVIQEYLQEAEKHLNIKQILQKNHDQKKRSYTLYEDLKLVFEYVNDNPETLTKGPKFLDHLLKNNIFYRSIESLRSRYKEFLRYLTKENFESIISFVENHGIDKGYLKFQQNQEGQKILVDILLEDPQEIQKKINKNTKENTQVKSNKENQQKANKQFEGKQKVDQQLNKKEKKNEQQLKLNKIDETPLKQKESQQLQINDNINNQQQQLTIENTKRKISQISDIQQNSEGEKVYKKVNSLQNGHQQDDTAFTKQKENIQIDQPKQQISSVVNQIIIEEEIPINEQQIQNQVKQLKIQQKQIIQAQQQLPKPKQSRKQIVSSQNSEEFQDQPNFVQEKQLIENLENFMAERSQQEEAITQNKKTRQQKTQQLFQQMQSKNQQEQSIKQQQNLIQQQQEQIQQQQQNKQKLKKLQQERTVDIEYNPQYQQQQQKKSLLQQQQETFYPQQQLLQNQQLNNLRNYGIDQMLNENNLPFQDVFQNLINSIHLSSEITHKQELQNSLKQVQLSILTDFSRNNRQITIQNVQVNQLTQIIEEFSEKFNISQVDLMNMLESVNGNISDLHSILVNPDLKDLLAWEDFEDQQLRQIRSKSDGVYKMLMKLKGGSEALKQRAQFIGIDMPFEF